MAVCFFAVSAGILKAATFSEDFNSDSFNALRWSPAMTLGNGELGVNNQRAEFTVSSAGGGGDSQYLGWQGPLPVDKNWEATLTVNNTHSPAAFEANSSTGLMLLHPLTDERLFVELYAWREGSVQRGFLSSLETDETIFGEVDTTIPGATLAYVRLSYNASTKVVTASYDQDGPGTTFGWVTHATFGLGGTGGSTANRNWNLAPANKFTLSFGAYAELTTIGAGTVWADNFSLSIPDYVAPAVSLSLQTTDVQISWPAAESVFKLESSPSLSPAVWSPVDTSPQLTGADYTVTLAKPAANTYWRLSY